MTAPGWYPDGQGSNRYWDGSGWTDQVAPGTQQQAPAPYAGQPAYVVPPGYEIKKKKRFYKRVWFWLVVIPVVLVIIVISAGSSAVNKAVNNPHTVVYTVTGTIGHADITYYSNDGTNTSQSASADKQPLPWTKTITIKGDFSGFDVSANTSLTLTSKAGTLACAITVDGKSVSTDTASGSADFVSCDGTGFVMSGALVGLHSKGRVNLSTIRNAPLRERHRAPRVRAVRLEADLRRAEVAVESFAVEATA
jgi:hypothetical protein